MNITKIKILIFSLLAFFALSCEDEETSAPEELVIEATIEPASEYNAADGSISLNIVKGEEPFIFHWNTGDSTSEISGLKAGDYNVTVTYGANGAAYTRQTFTIEQPEPEPLDLSFTVTDVQVYDKPQGSIELEVSGGQPPYTYLWSNGETSPVIENLLAGTYSVTVMDAGDPYSIETTGFAVVNQPEFVCGQDSIRDIDGNMYSTIVIGEQCWLGENLKTAHRPDSPTDELIPIEGRVCRGLFCQQQEGAHYDWHGMMNGAEPATLPDEEIQGICPAGWHIPTEEMFAELDGFLSIDGNGGDGSFSGAKMKGVESSSGFDALFAGNWGYGIYNNAPYASFWTSSEMPTNPNRAEIFYVTDDTPFLNSGHQPKEFGFNVRCIKDTE